MPERLRLQEQAAEMSFLYRVTGLSLELRHQGEAQSRAATHSCQAEPADVRMPLWTCSTHIHLGGDPEANLGHWGDYISRLPWKRVGMPLGNLWTWPRRGVSGFSQ